MAYRIIDITFVLVTACFIAAAAACLFRVRRISVNTADLRYMINSVQFEVITEKKAVKRAWWTVLGISTTATGAEIDAAYRAALKASHPDAGGRPKDLNIARLQNARSQAHEAIKVAKTRAEWDAAREARI